MIRVLPCGCALDGRACRDHAPPRETKYTDAAYFDARLDNAAVDFLTEAHRRAWLAQRHDDCLRHIRRLRQIRGQGDPPRPRRVHDEQADRDDAARDREPWVDWPIV